MIQTHHITVVTLIKIANAVPPNTNHIQTNKNNLATKKLNLQMILNKYVKLMHFGNSLHLFHSNSDSIASSLAADASKVAYLLLILKIDATNDIMTNAELPFSRNVGSA